MLIINLKAYEEGIGENLEKLAKKISELDSKTQEKIALSPQTVDILRLNDNKTEIFSQHLDSISPGSHTGSNLGRALKEAGIEGTLLNHSEKRLEDSEIKASVQKAKELGLKTIVCAQNPEECEKYSKYNPDYVAYEPPELIGGDKSVSTANPDLIKKAVEKSGDIPTLTGAGIKDSKDVKKSLELGCEGVLVASGIVKSENPKKVIQNLCDPL